MARHLYSVTAIAMALALWATAGENQATVRLATSPQRIVGPSERHRWRSLSRWTASAATGQLFPGRRWTQGDTARDTAAAIAMTFAAHGPPGDRSAPLPHRAWQGVLHMA